MNFGFSILLSINLTVFSLMKSCFRLDYQPLFGKGARTRLEKAAEIEPRVAYTVFIERLSSRVEPFDRGLAKHYFT